MESISVTAFKEYALTERLLLDRASHEGQAVRVLKEVLLLGKTRRIINTPIGDVTLNLRYFLHLVEKRSDARERYANFIIPTLQQPLEVWEVEYTDGSKRLLFIGLFEGKRQMAVIVKEVDGELTLWNVINKSKPAKLDQQRLGKLIYKKW